MPKFQIPVEWVMTATLEIEAASLEDAITEANEIAIIPANGTYREKSYLVNDEAAENLNCEFFAIKVELIGHQNRFPLCKENDCPFTRECANHETAGDFRIEDGLTPNLRLEGSDWKCSKKPKNNHGAVYANGKLMVLEEYR